MILIISTAIIGLLLIYFEFFLPGVVLGVLGGILLTSSILLYAFLIHPDAISLIVYIFAVIISSILMVRLAFVTVKRKREKNNFYLDKNQEGYIASIHQKELYGKTGMAATDLKPSGYIKIGEDFYQAVSKSGYIKKDEKVEVEGGEGARLIVKKI